MKENNFEAVVLTTVGRLKVSGCTLGVTSIEWSEEDLTEEVGTNFKDWIEKVRSLDFDVPFALLGTDLQVSVWEEIQKIPRGQTRTYKEIATAVGKPRAIRAVATACGKNRLALLVPCHRVVKSNGKIGKYRWGVDRKEMLLGMESE